MADWFVTRIVVHLIVFVFITCIPLLTWVVLRERQSRHG